MIWYGWLLLGVSIVGCLLWWRIVARRLLVDGEDLFTACVFGTLLAAFWPAALAIWIFCEIHGPQALRWLLLGGLGGQARAQDREKRIAELEKELGIGA